MWTLASIFVDDNKTDVTASVDCYYIFSAPKLRVRGRSLRMKTQERKKGNRERAKHTIQGQVQ